MTCDLLLPEDDSSVRIALALTPDICTRCSLCKGATSVSCPTTQDAPCPYFHPANFYYDEQLRKFWCHNFAE